MASIPARRMTLADTMPGNVLDLGTATASPYSPLDQLGLHSPLADLANDPLAKSASPTASPPQSQSSVTPAPAAIPPLKLNLFRSPSIYSVESGDSLSTISADDAVERYGYPLAAEPGSSSDTDTPLSPAEAPDDAYTSPDEADVIVFSTPSTPRARRFVGSNATSPDTSGAATPTAMLARREQRTDPDAPTLPYAPGTLRSAVSEGPFALRDVPVRTARSTSVSSSPTHSQAYSACRALSEPAPLSSSPSDCSPVAQLAISPRYPETAVAPDWASVHGEQGSDWGDDENDFEWLDSSDAPNADTLNDQQKGGQRRLARLSRRLSAVGVRAANSAASLVNGSASGSGSTPIPGSSKSSDNSHGAPAAADSSSSGTEGGCAPAPERRRTKKRRPYVIPRRPAPPPPPSGGITVIPVEVTRSRSPGKPRTGGAADRSSPSLDGAQDVTTPNNVHDDQYANMGSNSNLGGAEEQPLPPVVIITATPPRQGQAMLSVKDANADTMSKSASHQSAYSFYDLGDSPARTPDRSASGTFPRGKYARVPLHELNGTSPSGPSKTRSRVDTGSRHTRRPSADDALSAVSGRRGLRSPDSSATLSRTHSNRVPTLGEADMMSPDELVAAGLQRREAGDRPKSAWFFMKAAELGSVTGRIHWGIALRHGLGIARDERRAFTELSEACDRGLAEGVVDLRAAVGTLLSPSTARQMPRDLAVGLFELSNSYFDGAGTRRNADLALEYLRMAGSLGDMAAQEQLGLVLSKGINGVKKDAREAAKWYRAAIDNGSNTPGLAWVWKDKYNE